MGRRPRKAPETAPELKLVPLNADGSVVTASQLVKRQLAGEPIAARYEEVRAIGGRSIPRLFQEWVAHICDEYRDLLHRRIDWLEEMEAVLCAYQRRRFFELHGTDEQAVTEALRKIEAAALKLKGFLDLPKSDAPAFEAAWRRLRGVRLPNGDDNQELHDMLYPGLSRLVARANLLRKTSRAAPSTARNSLDQLIIDLATCIEARGLAATYSNSLAKGDDHENLSAFGRLVKAALECTELKPPCAMTAGAINKAIARALKQRRDNNA